MQGQWKKVGGTYSVPLMAQEQAKQLQSLMGVFQAEEARLVNQIAALRANLQKQKAQNG